MFQVSSTSSVRKGRFQQLLRKDEKKLIYSNGHSASPPHAQWSLELFFCLDPIPVGLFLSNIGWGTPPPLVSQDIMRKQCCNSHVTKAGNFRRL